MMFPIISIDYKSKIKYSIHAKLNELFDILFSYFKNFMLKYSNSPRNCTLKSLIYLLKTPELITHHRLYNNLHHTMSGMPYI